MNLDKMLPIQSALYENEPRQNVTYQSALYENQPRQNVTIRMY